MFRLIITCRQSNLVYQIVLFLLLILNYGISYAVEIKVCQPPDICDYQSIQLAIDVAVDGDEIVVHPGTYVENINFSGSNPTGPKAITIRSTDPDDPSVVDSTIIDGNSSGTVVTFNSGETPTSLLMGLTITNGTGSRPYGNPPYGGGIISLNGSYPTIEDCVIRDNENRSGSGGGIACIYAGATLKHCTIANNTAKFDGAIYVYSSSMLKILDSSIRDNSATWTAGGIKIRKSTAIINKCDISRNTTSFGIGGGIYACESSTLDVLSSVIDNNSSKIGGGVAGDDSSKLTILNCTIESNLAQEKGGGIYSSFATISNSTINGNTAATVDTPGYGGGIYDPYAVISFCDIIYNTVGGNIARGGGVYGGSVIEYCTINNNVASGSMASYGGGVHGGGRIVDCRIENNTASKGSGYGGGIYGVSEITSSIIQNNEASFNGGGINLTHTEASVNRCSIVKNTAIAGRGGGIFGPSWYRGTIANTNISSNSADLGGGIYCSLCTPKIINSTFFRNSASTSGGAIYSYNDNTNISLANTILWENEANGIPNEIHLDFDAVLNASYSIIKGGWPGIGNMDTDPLFADVSSPDPLQWNLHLTPLSPAIDSGDDLAFMLAEALDIDGGPRFYDGDEDIIATIDIGSDEYVLCPADFNYDGDIDANDLAEYINKDNTISSIDLEQFALTFGRMCTP